MRIDRVKFGCVTQPKSDMEPLTKFIFACLSSIVDKKSRVRVVGKLRVSCQRGGLLSLSISSYVLTT